MVAQYSDWNPQQASRLGHPDGGADTISATRQRAMMALEQRADKVSLWGIMFVAGYLTCAAVNGIAALPWLWGQHNELVQVKTTVVPALKAAVNCEHKRAEANADVAQQAILSAEAVDARAPSADAIVDDNCPHPAAPKK